MLTRSFCISLVIAFYIGIFTLAATAQETQGFNAITEKEFQSEIPTDYTSWPNYQGTCKVFAKDGVDTWHVSVYVPKASERSKYQLLEIVEIQYATNTPLTLVLYEEGPTEGEQLDILRMYLKKDTTEVIKKLDFKSSDAFERIQRMQQMIGVTLINYCREIFDQRLNFLQSNP